MVKHFIMLEWKAFLRSASLGTNIVMKIFIGLFAAYFMVIFIAAGVGVFLVKVNFVGHFGFRCDLDCKNCSLR